MSLCCSYPPCWRPTSSLATTLEVVLDSTCDTTAQSHPVGGSSDHSKRALSRANTPSILQNDQPPVSSIASHVNPFVSSADSHRERKPSHLEHNLDPLDLEIVALIDSIVDSTPELDSCTHTTSTNSTEKSDNDSTAESDIVTMLETYLTSNTEPNLTLDLQPYFDSLFTPMFTPP